ncbi:MAG: hypothetical protein WC647_04635 [Desulfomonilaceae bacterium]|jgi:hypothetical protein
MAQLQVDRLGLRLTVDEDLIFRGTIGSKIFTNTQSAADDYISVSELDISSSRLGFFLDIIRNPFLRAGIDFEWNVNPVTFRDMKLAVTPKQGGSTITDSKYIPTIPPDPTPPWYLEEYRIDAVYGVGRQRLRQSSSGPACLGLHMFAIPARVREVPITVQAKINFPFPYWQKIWGIEYEARMLGWEVTAGARPAVWDASAFGA